MSKHLCGALLAAGLAGPVWGDSLRLTTLADGGGGSAADLGAHFAPLEALTLGAEIGGGRSASGDQVFDGRSWRVSLDCRLGALSASMSSSLWRDPDQLSASDLHGELGWMSATGVSLAALATTRHMHLYDIRAATVPAREGDMDFQGTGYGIGLSYSGPLWRAGVRFLRYGHDADLARVRAALQSSDPGRLAALGRLAGSVGTRTAATPEHEVFLTLGHETGAGVLTGELGWQRDALTGVEIRSLGLTLGFEARHRLGVELTMGLRQARGTGAMAWGGIALTVSDTDAAQRR